MILDGVEIKDVSKCWMDFVYNEHYMFRAFIIRINVTPDIAQDQNLLLVIMVEECSDWSRDPVYNRG